MTSLPNAARALYSLKSCSLFAPINLTPTALASPSQATEQRVDPHVGKGPQSRETIDAVANLEVNPAIGMDVVHEAALVDELCWDVAQFDADVLRLVQRCLKVEGFDVEGDKLGAPAGKDAVKEQLDEVEGGGLGPDVSGIFDVLDCDGDASAVEVILVGEKCANDFGERDSLAAVRRDVIVEDDVECVGALQ